MTDALIIEDDACSALALQSLLDRVGIRAATVPDTDTALQMVRESLPDILIADWNVVGDVSSLEVAKHLRERRPESQVFFISGFERGEIEELLSDFSPCTIYTKPLNFDAILLEIKRGASEAGNSGHRVEPFATL